MQREQPEINSYIPHKPSSTKKRYVPRKEVKVLPPKSDTFWEYYKRHIVDPEKKFIKDNGLETGLGRTLYCLEKKQRDDELRATHTEDCFDILGDTDIEEQKRVLKEHEYKHEMSSLLHIAMKSDIGGYDKEFWNRKGE